MVSHQSIMEREITMRDLIDRRTLAEVCVGLFNCFGVPFRVYDAGGTLYAEAGAETGNIPATMLKKLLALRLMPARPAEHSAPTGQKYFLFQLTAQGEEAGRLIAGPVDLRGHTDGASEARAAEITTGVGQIVDALMFVGLKNALTSGMHLEAMTDAYRELEAKNRALSVSYQRLKELSEMKTNFLQTVSHELKTPLTSVIGYSEVLLEGLAGELTTEQREYLGTILSKGEALLGMINSMLDITRMGASYQDLDITLCQPRDVVTVATEPHTEDAARRKIAIVKDCDPELPQIYVDLHRMGRALGAVVSNAIKFSPEGARIVVAARVERRLKPGPISPFEAEDEEMFVFEVRDQGIGIPADKLESIFESFYQVDSSSTREYGGAGLGLTIARNFVEVHRGRVEVESTPGKGSTFTMTFRVEEISTPPPHIERPADNSDGTEHEPD